VHLEEFREEYINLQEKIKENQISNLGDISETILKQGEKRILMILDK